MKHIRRFNEGFENPINDSQLIPLNLFRCNDETRKLVAEKIKNLENDANFTGIMDMIKSGEIIQAETTPTKNFFNIGQQIRFVLSDNREITVDPVKTWEKSDGDYDTYYTMTVDKSPLGYISYPNYRYILGEVINGLDEGTIEELPGHIDYRTAKRKTGY